MVEDDVQWLAGIVEGEGNIRFHNRTQQLTITSTDFDVVDRVKLLINGHVGVKKRYASHYKTCYTVITTGQRARNAMSLIQPFMGNRRYNEINIAYTNTDKNRRKRNLSFFCGVLEGEATFGQDKIDGVYYPRITVAMKDRDIVTACRDFFDVGNLWETKSGLLRWRISKKVDAQGVMSRCLPYMGQRRTSRIQEILDWSNTNS